MSLTFILLTTCATIRLFLLPYFLSLSLSVSFLSRYRYPVHCSSPSFTALYNICTASRRSELTPPCGISFPSRSRTLRSHGSTLVITSVLFLLYPSRTCHLCHAVSSLVPWQLVQALRTGLPKIEKKNALASPVRDGTVQRIRGEGDE